MAQSTTPPRCTDTDLDGGLSVDLPTLLRQIAEHGSPDRRRALRWLGSALALGLPLAACGGGDGDAGATTGGTTTGGGTGSATCAVINEETAGPYPGDGSNSNAAGVANALALSGIVRRDIRSSIAGATGTAAGVPLTLNIVLVNTGVACAALQGYAIYLWHCDALGRYSMYSSGVTGENYLRGVQPTDATGTATFTTVFPGCYAGRMPHLHFEVYRSTATAASHAAKLRTSQIALPVDVATAVYASAVYGNSAANLGRISFATDNVFGDGVALQLATLSGNATDGYVATLQVGIAA